MIPLESPKNVAITFPADGWVQKVGVSQGASIAWTLSFSIWVQVVNQSTSFVDLVCFFLSCVCYAFVRVCFYVPWDHLLGKG